MSKSSSRELMRRFLDLEAEVDKDASASGSDTEDSEGLGGGFINDEDDDPENELPPPSQLVEWSRRVRSNDDDDFDGDPIFSNLYQRIRTYKERPFTDIDDANVNENDWGRISRLPRYQEDYPLYRVRCRSGLEEDAIFFLLQTATTEKHCMRSAFTHSGVGGWIYLEAKMNPALAKLLRSTPGVNRVNVVPEIIPFEDWTRSLTMRNPSAVFEVGKWTRVTRGLYKGDVGLIVNVTQPGVELLLVSRLANPSKKRKRSKTVPKQVLFDPDTCKVLYGMDAELRRPHVYASGPLIFEYGLLRKVFNFNSISSSALDIPSTTLLLYQLSEHPMISSSTFPNPKEWIFEDGELVIAETSLGRHPGAIKAITPEFLEIDFGQLCGDEIGIEAVPWSRVRKAVNVGDYVTIMSGSYHGINGMVVGIENDIVQIIVEKEGDTFVTNPDTLRNAIQTHINWVKVISAPFSLASVPSTAEPTMRDRVPWLGTSVLITKYGSPLKGYRAVVKDVAVGQDTFSGLKLDLQLENYDASKPYPIVRVDYDDVVEFKSQMKLFDYSPPSSRLFQPSDEYLQELKASNQPVKSVSWLHSTSSTSSMSCATPLPDFVSSTTPAWDPSSRTPGPIISQTPTWNSSSLTPVPFQRVPTPPLVQPVASTSQTTVQAPVPQHEHPLLDARLMGYKLKVVVGGSYKDKEFTVSVIKRSGQLCFQHAPQITLAEIIPPDLVKIKHPNPKQHKGYLVVIKGDHYGKLVRRLHFQGDNMILAVLKKEKGVVDVVTEEIMLSADYLCICAESRDKESKQLKEANEELMVPLREAARKRLKK